jgi:hypothetical protein
MQHVVLDTTRCSTWGHTTHTSKNVSITRPFCQWRPSGSECFPALDASCRSSLHLVPRDRLELKYPQRSLCIACEVIVRPQNHSCYPHAKMLSQSDVNHHSPPSNGSNELRLNDLEPNPKRPWRRSGDGEVGSQNPSAPARVNPRESCGLARAHRYPNHVPFFRPRYHGPEHPSHPVPNPFASRIPLSTPEGRPGRPRLSPTGTWWPSSIPCLAHYP